MSTDGNQARAAGAAPVSGPERATTVLVDIPGWVMTPEDVAVAFPTLGEGFGIPLLEALAHGVPVIASKGTPWSGVETHGCGLWIENDPATLAAAIERMSRMALREMGERGRRWMEQEFAWETVAREMLQLYGKLLLKDQSAP